LHSGSVMVTATDSRVIDPEFAFYGPIGFDLGAFFGNLLLSWYSQAGHEALAGDRSGHRAWILEQVRVFWNTFRSQFAGLWREKAAGDAYPRALFRDEESRRALERLQEAYLDALFSDMLGFGACKMIRRILGFAHVLDFEGIADANARARCEAAALGMAASLLTQPDRFRSIDDVIEAVPRARSYSCSP
jgi:5-methylthioribose kinase